MRHYASVSFSNNAIQKLRFCLIGLILAIGSSVSLAQAMTIVAFGDSTTATRRTVKQVYAQRLPDLLKVKGVDAKVINAGVGGSHTGHLKDNNHHKRAHALDRLDNAVRNHQPNIVLIQFGINDSWVDSPGGKEGASRISLDKYLANLTYIVKTLKADGARPILMTPNMLGKRHETWRLERLNLYVQVMRNVAAKQGVELIDVWKLYQAYATQPNKHVDDLLLDGSHPNDLGHSMLAAVIVEQILTKQSTQTPKFAQSNKEAVRVACIGDSITFGARIKNRTQDSYPAQLQTLLGDRFVVKNFGVPGSGVCKSGKRSNGWRRYYMVHQSYKDSLSYEPHIVICNLGINDITHWKEWGDEFVSSYVELIKTYQQLPTKPKILIWHKLAPLFSGQAYYGDANLEKLNAAIAQVAQKTGVQTIDLYEPLKGAGALFPDRIHPNAAGAKLIAKAVEEALVDTTITKQSKANPYDKITILTIDLNSDKQRQVVVDKEKGQYLGHPTTCVLDDGKTMLCVYPRGHGRGAIVYKRSYDGGLTWSKRLPTPSSWATSKEVPTLHRVIDPEGKKRIIMWSGLYPARLAVTEDDGKNWSQLKPVGEWGGIVVMGFVEPLNTGKGHYIAMFHDDGRFFSKTRKRDGVMTLYQTFSKDGGLTWSFPEKIFASSKIHLCEPGCIRSPDGKQLAVLLRENRRVKNSHVIFSNDEGKTWTKPRELPLSLTGDRHTGKYGPDGRLFISFRGRAPRQKAQGRPFEGDWVGWIGTYADIANGREGQYFVRMKDNTHGYDTTYPGVEILPDGTFVTTTYGHWDKGEKPYILTVRFKLDELDRKAKSK